MNSAKIQVAQRKRRSSKNPRPQDIAGFEDEEDLQDANEENEEDDTKSDNDEELLSDDEVCSISKTFRREKFGKDVQKYLLKWSNCAADAEIWAIRNSLFREGFFMSYSGSQDK